MRLHLAAACAAFAAAACLRAPTYQCATAAQCEQGGVAGRCEPTGYCAAPDPGCTSGYRWSPGAPDAGACVDGPAPRAVDVCLEQGPLSVGDDVCVASVCAVEPRCCTHEWSTSCVLAAETGCGHPCGDVLAAVGQGRVRVSTWSAGAWQTLWDKATYANDSYSAVTWGDLDGDGKPELITCESPPPSPSTAPGKLTIWHNGGSCGEPFCQLAQGDIGGCYHVALTDIDGDGDLDVVAGGGYTGYLWIDDHGLFAAVDNSLFFGKIDASFALADLDADGLPDVALAQYEQPLVVLRTTLGTPPGPITLTSWWDDHADAAHFSHETVAWGDVDGDGLPDLLSGAREGIVVWRDTSTTAFAADATPYFHLDGPDVRSLVAADVDEDGDLDLVALTDSGPVFVLRNDRLPSGGTFTATPLWTSADSYGTGELQVADVDGDHHLDIVVAAVPAAPGPSTAVYLNHPAELGHFGATGDKPDHVDHAGLNLTGLALTHTWQ